MGDVEMVLHLSFRYFVPLARDGVSNSLTWVRFL